MPFVYGLNAGADVTLSGTPGTEVDMLAIKAGATRNVAVQSYATIGKGAALTSISGIVYRCKQYPTTATAVGSGSTLVPVPRDPGAQAAKSTAFSGAAGALTAGTGTLLLHAAFGSGAAGPGGWVFPNADSMPVLEGAATKSIDLFCASNTASLKAECSAEVVE